MTEGIRSWGLMGPPADHSARLDWEWRELETKLKGLYVAKAT